MKKITLLLGFIALFFTSIQIQAQAIDEPAGWPNAAWTVEGNFTASALSSDPRTTENFSFDDNAAGSGSLFDVIAAVSPVIDLTPATTAVPAELEIFVLVDYTFTSSGDALTLDWYNNDTHLWQNWYTFQQNATNLDYETCDNLQTVSSTALNIAGFSPGQLANFQYRITFNDNGHTWGMCFGSPTLSSQETPLCFNVSNIASRCCS